MEMTEKAAPPTAYLDNEINGSHLKQEQGLVQLMKSEPALLVQEESLEDSQQGTDEQQGVLATSTCALVGRKCLAADIVEQGQLLYIKEELEDTDLDIGPTVFQHVDSHYRTNQMDLIKQKNAILNLNPGEILPGIDGGQVVGKQVRESSPKDDNEPQCVEGTSTLASAGNMNEASSTSLGELFNVKHEMEEMDIGPTVLQHMDIHYTNNKTLSGVPEENTISSDCNKAMPCNEVKKESVEDNLRDRKTTSRKYYGQAKTDEDTDKVLKSCHGQQKNLAGPRNQSRNETVKQKPFACDVCGKGYSSKSGLYMHKRLHSGVGLSVCHICNAKCTTKSNLANHLRTHTGEKPYQCDICNKRFALSNTLYEHMRIHTDVKPYHCDKCNAKFSRSYALTQHLRFHTDEMPYQCDTCYARFAQRNNLIVHMRGHTRGKPYQCDVCDAKFAQRGGLTVHMRVHTGEKPYQCDICDARFTQSSALIIHKRVHTGVKPFACSECGAKFGRQDHLNLHLRRRHTQ